MTIRSINPDQSRHRFRKTLIASANVTCSIY